VVHPGRCGRFSRTQPSRRTRCGRSAWRNAVTTDGQSHSDNRKLSASTEGVHKRIVNTFRVEHRVRTSHGSGTVHGPLFRSFQHLVTFWAWSTLAVRLLGIVVLLTKEKSQARTANALPSSSVSQALSVAAAHRADGCAGVEGDLPVRADTDLDRNRIVLARRKRARPATDAGPAVVAPLLRQYGLPPREHCGFFRVLTKKARRNVGHSVRVSLTCAGGSNRRGDVQDAGGAPSRSCLAARDGADRRGVRVDPRSGRVRVAARSWIRCTP
jgi:hypothetical protein